MRNKKQRVERNPCLHMIKAFFFCFSRGGEGEAEREGGRRGRKEGKEEKERKKKELVEFTRRCVWWAYP